MAKPVDELQQSLDGYVDHMKLGPPPAGAFRHFIELARKVTGFINGRHTNQIMRYWNEDLPDWNADEHEFAAAWRSRPKWVVSQCLTSVGPNAKLVGNDWDKVIRGVNTDLMGAVHIGGSVWRKA